jgi:hypothetical protein
LAGEIARKRAGDVEGKRVAVEQALGQQSRRHQRADLLSEIPLRLLGARPDRTRVRRAHKVLAAAHGQAQPTAAASLAA